jgi:hypothetical protein
LHSLSVGLLFPLQVAAQPLGPQSTLALVQLCESTAQSMLQVPNPQLVTVLTHDWMPTQVMSHAKSSGHSKSAFVHDCVPLQVMLQCQPSGHTSWSPTHACVPVQSMLQVSSVQLEHSCGQSPP